MRLARPANGSCSSLAQSRALSSQYCPVLRRSGSADLLRAHESSCVLLMVSATARVTRSRQEISGSSSHHARADLSRMDLVNACTARSEMGNSSSRPNEYRPYEAPSMPKEARSRTSWMTTGCQLPVRPLPQRPRPHLETIVTRVPLRRASPTDRRRVGDAPACPVAPLAKAARSSLQVSQCLPDHHPQLLRYHDEAARMGRLRSCARDMLAFERALHETRPIVPDVNGPPAGTATWPLTLVRALLLLSLVGWGRGRAMSVSRHGQSSADVKPFGEVSTLLRWASAATAALSAVTYTTLRAAYGWFYSGLGLSPEAVGLTEPGMFARGLVYGALVSTQVLLWLVTGVVTYRACMRRANSRSFGTTSLRLRQLIAVIPFFFAAVFWLASTLHGPASSAEGSSNIAPTNSVLSSVAIIFLFGSLGFATGWYASIIVIAISTRPAKSPTELIESLSTTRQRRDWAQSLGRYVTRVEARFLALSLVMAAVGILAFSVVVIADSSSQALLEGNFESVSRYVPQLLEISLEDVSVRLVGSEDPLGICTKNLTLEYLGRNHENTYVLAVRSGSRRPTVLTLPMTIYLPVIGTTGTSPCAATGQAAR
jgi:hypothetical protein